MGRKSLLIQTGNLSDRPGPASQALRSTTTLAAVCGIVMAVTSGCGHSKAAPDAAGTTVPAATAPPATTPVTQAPSTTVPTTAASTTTPTAPATTVALGPVVPAAGSLLQTPNPAIRGSEPTTIPAEADCHNLVTGPPEITNVFGCATASGPSGTITGVDEGSGHTQEWDIWRRSGSVAVLTLSYSGNFQSTPGFVFHSADPANDGDPKLLAMEHTPGTQPVAAVDIIEATGAVVAHVVLGPNGVTGPAPGGGIETWTHAADSSTATATVIRYTAGAWRITSSTSVPLSQVPSYPNDDGYGGGLP